MLSLLLLSLVPAQAAPVNPWTGSVGEGVFALTPFLYVDQTPLFYPLVYGQYGFTDQLELLVRPDLRLGRHAHRQRLRDYRAGDLPDRAHLALPGAEPFVRSERLRWRRGRPLRPGAGARRGYRDQ
jgi:hypothetical protein